jgi:hypothetical protein
MAMTSMSYFLRLSMIHRPPSFTHTYTEFSTPAHEILLRHHLHLVALEMEIMLRQLQLHLQGLVDQYLRKRLRRQYSLPTVHLVIGQVQVRLPHMAMDCILPMLKSLTLMLNYLLSLVTSLVRRQALSIRKALLSYTTF